MLYYSFQPEPYGQVPAERQPFTLRRQPFSCQLPDFLRCVIRQRVHVFATLHYRKQLPRQLFLCCRHAELAHTLPHSFQHIFSAGIFYFQAIISVFFYFFADSFALAPFFAMTEHFQMPRGHNISPPETAVTYASMARYAFTYLRHFIILDIRQAATYIFRRPRAITRQPLPAILCRSISLCQQALMPAGC